ncbi:UDP-N-acetylmuramate--L-alanine ligase [Candidatus Cetobacterium colombiensis]|uniref:UDP-N-acetylmuramate--L-alanine ligase n=1 Tax=Candidatus Cetobacterium colombiensis TaxID=3073100 RepID=A0ABU4WA90_9FUSO|nr:UDP-N-acetylmuramate--L-alanine ligase [Candidatus Cetobacterium colombiensis]MDX8336436.1 UDP-N-acetylmuramate--L-alanine ligase [Candidatus Cetobacterium colombiensis]
MNKIYFIGINGIGMSGLAKIMKLKGYEVSGADLSRNYVTEELESLGITVYNSHLAENVCDVNLVVASSAIKQDNPEIKKAQELGIKIIKRGELLSLLMNKEKGIAVAGTHGKTTTSSMLGSLLLDIDPTIVVGGILPEIGSNARCGKIEVFIAEADESDNSFLHLTPETAIITNIEADHLENHGSLENIKKSFKQFMDQTKGEILVCGDCFETLELIKNRKNVKTYGINKLDANIMATDIRVENGRTKFKVTIEGKVFGEFEISIPGNHNIQNALPVIYLAKKYGISKTRISEKLLKFKGAKRRYDILHSDKIRIIDDYAHHPTEIKATIQGAKTIEKNKTIAIFQPHRYSRVNFLLNDFKGSFEGVDEVILMPVYSAGEKNEFGVTLEKLKEKIGHKHCIIVEKNEDIEKIVAGEKESATFLFMGAGNISSLAHMIAENIGRTGNEVI